MCYFCAFHMKHFVQKNFISIAIASVFALILISAGLSYHNRQVMIRANLLREQAELIKRETENTYQNIRSMDISIRGFAIMLDPRYLFLSVDSARATNRRNFHTLDHLLEVQGYHDPEAYAALKQGLSDYVDLYEQMISLIKQNDLEGFKKLLAEDRGKHFFQTYDRFATRLIVYENKLYEESQAEYEAAMNGNNLVQIILTLVGLPTLVIVIRKLQQEAKNRQALLLNLKQNNQQYLFNPGKEAQESETEKILETSIQNLKKAAQFINHISEGNYQADWEELNEDNQALNKDNLVGRLMHMREQMKKAKLEDEKRMWATEGLTKFTEIIRNHQHNLQDLSHHALVFLVQYLHAQQGGLFLLREQEGSEAYLELAACYAFERKKYLKKRIEIGEGIVGQTYLEGETTILTELPQKYTLITSGLGGTTPSNLLIVPMKYNDKVEAIVEMASLQLFQPYEISFIEKAGEFIASAIATAQTNEVTQSLLKQFREQTEQMRAQEEELRQNMEELEATQEEMRRKEQELERRLQEINQS